jgi:hypothetical protein
MNRILIIFSFFLLVGQHLQAQLMHNKLNVFAGINRGFVIGNNEFYSDKEFVAPSALGNLNSIKGLQLKASYNVSPRMSFGMGADFQSWGGWEHPIHNDYKGIRIGNMFVSPHIKLHTPYALQGIFNRLTLYAEMAPGLGYSRTKVDQPILLVFHDNGEVEHPYQSGDFFMGLHSSIGAGFILTSSFGLFVSFSTDYYRMYSPFYLDRNMIISRVEAGLFLRLRQDQRQFFVIPF